MRQRVGRVFTILSLIAIASLVLAGCTSAGGGGATAQPTGKQLYDLSCASCHGVTGQGNTFSRKGQTIKVPALSWSDLSQAYATVPSRGSVEKQVSEAISKGLDEKGEALNPMMPRWASLSKAQVDSLVNYVKTTFK